MQRCSSSISANIAEGAGRNSKKEFINFLSIANGSAYELHSFVVLIYELDFISEENKKSLLDKNNHIIRMNVKLQENLKRKLELENPKIR
jgi:four helix bundle protein